MLNAYAFGKHVGRHLVLTIQYGLNLRAVAHQHNGKRGIGILVKSGQGPLHHGCYPVIAPHAIDGNGNRRSQCTVPVPDPGKLSFPGRNPQLSIVVAAVPAHPVSQPGLMALLAFHERGSLELPVRAT
jgi:hypothetical protein